MTDMMKIVMPKCGFNDPSIWPNSCNLNLYEDGGMSVGWHSDDESLFQGKFNDICIISLSLGAGRKFELRANWPAEGERPVQYIILGDGDLCTMEGMTQKHFQHRVPKENNVTAPRINLTWRWTVKHTPKCPASRRRF
jgi:alkylated DNA repair dioxygenase AlkB